eukprot:Skav226039  [mRNA]  locus=scaffold2502:181408:182621:- [translate_table: standard]
MAAVEDTAPVDFDDYDFDDFDEEDYETLPCSFKYVRICLLLPSVNGFLNAFLWPAYSLYFEEMGWPLVRAGLSITVGFGSRVFLQQLQLRSGYWMIVPLSAIHLAIVVLGLVFQTSEWAVFLQIVAWLAIDPTCAIEGIAFDTFGDSETQARQATSTVSGLRVPQQWVLSVFTIAFACSCTFGGILYDLGSWTGVAMYHLILQGLMLVLLALEPACRHSFMRVFFADADEEMDLDPENAETKGKKSKGSKDPFEIGDQMFIAVIPDAPEIKLPSAVDELQIEEVTGTEDGKREKSQSLGAQKHIGPEIL